MSDIISKILFGETIHLYQKKKTKSDKQYSDLQRSLHLLLPSGKHLKSSYQLSNVFISASFLGVSYYISGVPL